MLDAEPGADGAAQRAPRSDRPKSPRRGRRARARAGRRVPVVRPVAAAGVILVTGARRVCWLSSPAPHDGRAASPRETTFSRSLDERDEPAGPSHGRCRSGCWSWTITRSSAPGLVAVAGAPPDSSRWSRRRARGSRPSARLAGSSPTSSSWTCACRTVRGSRPAATSGPSSRRCPSSSSRARPTTESVFAAIIAGANGYVLKQSRSTKLVAVLTAAGRGESLLDPTVTERVLDRVRQIATGTYVDETTHA